MARLLSRSPRRVCVPNRATRAPWWGGNGSGVVDGRALRIQGKKWQEKKKHERQKVVHSDVV